jgi:DNA-binding NtrC family response regulator
MSEPRSILVVDDDVAVGKVLFALLKQAGYRVRHVTSGAQALVAVGEASYDAVVSDLKMPGMDGMELLAALKEHDPALPVVMLTAHGTIALAVEAMRLGAVDFLTKPPEREALLYVIDKATKVASKAQDEPPERPRSPGGIIGSSRVMAECLSLVERAAKSPATVLVRGESGTGKELVARAIHEQSPRKDAPFVAVHCAALPENLLESELFGYVKGAFTGATSDKPGRVEIAEGGTLFFDEIGDVPPSIQVKLLRLLNEKEYTPVGATRERKADVRFVFATHRDLEEMVQGDEFREDLFYRLNVVPIHLPPLRDRGDDVEELARHFLRELGPQNGKEGLSFTDEAIAALAKHDFPGNVRELANMVERLVIFCDGEAIEASDVDKELSSRPPVSTSAAASSDSLAEDIAATKAAAVRDALTRANGNRTKAARLLGVSRRTLYNWMDELGIGS